ncbi:unnamed protein product [Cuscuta europaea]|uniref:Uncharacterized protein n=1 Tax=Cuscuta europaea TaxID=41803 RepID=A0A9P0ZFH8_CUSEU|nr:unnamed protein product [Cuscuta europaea]
MEWAISAVNKAASSNTVVNVFLLSVFGALSARSFQQQRDIEALEAEKNSIVKSNKEMRKTMWEWRQQLYADVEALSSQAIVPLSKLKSIFGDKETAAPDALTFPSSVFYFCSSGDPLCLHLLEIIFPMCLQMEMRKRQIQELLSEGCVWVNSW